jgi:hypothetical protein
MTWGHMNLFSLALVQNNDDEKLAQVSKNMSLHDWNLDLKF